MGDPDDLKLRSSMTLFSLVGSHPEFRRVLEKYFKGEPDATHIGIAGTSLSIVISPSFYSFHHLLKCCRIYLHQMLCPRNRPLFHIFRILLKRRDAFVL